VDNKKPRIAIYSGQRYRGDTLAVWMLSNEPEEYLYCQLYCS